MKTKVFYTLSILSMLAMAVMAGCSGSNGKNGTNGATGPAGPTMPVIQSVTAYGLPAVPGSSFTAVVMAQSAQGLALTYTWTVSKGWNVVSGGANPTATIKATGGYDAVGYAMVTVTDSDLRTATGVALLNTLYGAWGSAAAIETNANDAYDPQIAFDPSGNAIAVWDQSDGTYYRIYANRYAAGTGWGSAAAIETNANNAYYPQIAFDPSGNAIAVWYQWDGTYNRIYANRYQ